MRANRSTCMLRSSTGETPPSATPSGLAESAAHRRTGGPLPRGEHHVHVVLSTIDPAREALQAGNNRVQFVRWQNGLNDRSFHGISRE